MDAIAEPTTQTCEICSTPVSHNTGDGTFMMRTNDGGIQCFRCFITSAAEVIAETQEIDPQPDLVTIMEDDTCTAMHSTCPVCNTRLCTERNCTRDAGQSHYDSLYCMNCSRIIDHILSAAVRDPDDDAELLLLPRVLFMRAESSTMTCPECSTEHSDSNAFNYCTTCYVEVVREHIIAVTTRQT